MNLLLDAENKLRDLENIYGITIRKGMIEGLGIKEL